ncbi:hypothetical protein [Actinomycetospora flava]|uniref:Uncharacterized protein n=1 Tax=Actinomycetospora flava TaxID=3129232 RepID=A0ABU8MEI6_9PSEU
MGASLIVVAVPLGVGSYQVFRAQSIVTAAQPVADDWARSRSWQVVDVTMQQGVLQIVAGGPPPGADPGALRAALDGAGLADVSVRLSEVLGGSRDLPASTPP